MAYLISLALLLLSPAVQAAPTDAQPQQGLSFPVAESSQASGLSQAPVPQKLTAQEAVRLALENSPQLKQSRVSYLAARSGLLSARELRTTSVFAGLSQGSVGGGSAEMSASAGSELAWKLRSGDSLSATVIPASTSNYTSTMQLRYRRPLIQGAGSLSDTAVGITNAEYDVLMSDDQLFLARQSLVQTTVRNYFQAVRARDLIAVSESDIEISKETVRMARRKLEEGLVAEIEVSQAEIQLAQSEDELVSRKRAYQDALDALLLGMGLKVGQKPDLIDTVPQERVKLNPAELVEEALQKRRDLSVVDIGVKRQRLDLDLASNGLQPQLNAVGGFTKAGLGFGGSDSYTSATSWTAGLEYTMPLGSVSRRERKLMAARSLDQLLTQREFQRQEIRNEVLEATRSMDAAEASIDILEANLDVAQKNLTTAQRMVEEGLRLNRDLLDAQVSLARVKSSLLSAQISYYLSRINLYLAVGRDLAAEVSGGGLEGSASQGGQTSTSVEGDSKPPEKS
ncbi:MAG: TolC family protein [Armatimonadetes bacterium]|nr:TolC family protein [Armatimonadota bacterium]